MIFISVNTPTKTYGAGRMAGAKCRAFVRGRLQKWPPRIKLW